MENVYFSMELKSKVAPIADIDCDIRRTAAIAIKIRNVGREALFYEVNIVLRRRVKDAIAFFFL